MGEMITSKHQQSGIYRIYCSVSGKSYIGSATVLCRRKSSHLHDLRHGRHHSLALQHAYRKYGEAAFRFELLEYCPIDQLFEREDAWFAKRLADEGNRGYNMAPKAGGTHGYKYHPDVLARHRERCKLHRGQVTPAARAAYEMRKQRPPTEAEEAYHERRRNMPLTPAQVAAYAKWKEQPPTERQIRGRRNWAGKKQSPEMIAKRLKTLAERMDDTIRGKHRDASQHMWDNRSNEERQLIHQKVMAGFKVAIVQRRVEQHHIVKAALAALGWEHDIPKTLRQTMLSVREQTGLKAYTLYTVLEELEAAGEITMILTALRKRLHSPTADET